MGVSKQSKFLLGAVYLYCSLALVWGRQNGILQDPSLLVCDQRGLQFILPWDLEEKTSLSLTGWDGRLHPLQNNSACGTWVAWAPDGSIKAGVSYAGCYGFQWNGYYLMVIGVEGRDATGDRLFHEEAVLRCPIDLPALDAPSHSICADIQSSDRLPCASQSITQAEYSGNPCYYGNTVTAHCTPEAQFIIAIARAVTLPPLILDSVHLVSGHGAGCAPVVRNNAFVLYQFPLSACGTTFQMDGDRVVYENEVVADWDVRVWRLGSITRDSMFRLHVRCSYSTSSNYLPVSVQVFTLPPPPAVSQPGPLTLELQIATGNHYGSYYTDQDYPVVKLLRDPIYVEVRILQRTDPSLALVLHHCWATPNANPQQQPQWPVLVDGCPYTGDNYQTQLVPVGADSSLKFPSHHQRFIISTFTFVDSASQGVLTGLVYLHCSASVCQPSVLESCVPSCPAAVRKCLPLHLCHKHRPLSCFFSPFPLPHGLQVSVGVAQSLESPHNVFCAG
uniref:ZP domain-containing protein n=1 Tax=Sphenodon punctatus TaxID=8508 RepID=A0A8D0HRM3_SPHPU